MSWGQPTKQILGQFPFMDGGMEGQIAIDPMRSNSQPAIAFNYWTVTSTSANLRAIVTNSANARTGNTYLAITANSTAGAASPPAPSTGVGLQASTSYTVQWFYKKTAGTDNQIQKAFVSQTGTSGVGVQSGVGTYSPTGVNDGTSWTKVYATVSTNATATAINSYASFRPSGATTGSFSAIYDDFVTYEGSVDLVVPTAPSAPSIPSPAATQLTINWTAPGNALDATDGLINGGYMVVRSLIAPIATPNQNGVYAIGNTVAAGETVVYIGTNNTYTDIGLTQETTYYYRIYSVDKAFNYSTPIDVNATTTVPSYATVPTVQASNVTFSSVTSTGFTINFATGNGTNNIVLIKSGSAVDSDPVLGTSYTANTVFGSGTLLGAGNYVVYNGAAGPVTVTGLTKLTNYYVKVYSFNGSAGSENYLITSPASNNQITLPGEISSNGIGGGSWNTTAAWSGGVIPGATDNVTIVAGDNVLVTGNSCFNLTINAGGKVYNNTPQYTTSVSYVTVFGTSLVCNGTLGDKTIISPAIDGALGINFNQDLTISGSGLIRPARIRPNTNTQNATLTIDADMDMTYIGSTGTGGAAIYATNSGNDNITFTVNSGKTLSLVPLANFNTQSSSGSNGSASTTINVNGTLTMGANSNLSLPITLGKTATLNIGSTGIVNAYKLNATSASGGAAPAINIASGGLLSVSNTADFGSDTLSATVTGDGTFTLESGALIDIGTATGLEPVAGPIRTTTRNFNTAANYTYSGSAAQVTGSDLPTTVNNLKVDNAAGLTLGANTTVGNTLTITTGNLTIPTGKNLTVNTTIANSGTITVENNANLIQTSVTDTNSGSGTAIVKRNSNDLKRLDYTLWSSPVAGQKLIDFSPLTVNERFYTYNPSTNIYNGTDTSLNFIPGTGYLIRMPDNADAGTPTPYAGQFTGTLNNGDVSIPVSIGTYNAIGNPYPSVVFANDFINGNSTDGTLYFWRKTNGAIGTAYASYNLVGVTVTSDPGTGGIPPNGHIQVGQGFIVKATSTSLNFTNAMRELAPTSTQILKTKQVVQQDRIWLNMTTTSGVFSQALVGYVDGATLGVDNGYDGKYINDSPVALTSNINGEEYTIQGRPAFDATDVVALNFKTDVAGDYTIAIDHIDGVFANGQDVFLLDSKTGTETDLKAGSYTFSAVAGTDNARFSLKYQKTLKVNTPAFNENSVTVYRNNGTIYINSGASAINSVKVYDLLGRVLAEQNNMKTNSATINLKAAHQVLIVKVSDEDNTTVSKKVVN